MTRQRGRRFKIGLKKTVVHHALDTTLNANFYLVSSNKKASFYISRLDI
jgi:hypothetical protein